MDELFEQENKYINNVSGTLYSTTELLSTIFSGFFEELNLLASDLNSHFSEDIDVQQNVYNLFCNENEEVKLASKIFITFHPHKTIFGNHKYIVTINLSKESGLMSNSLHKKLPGLVKKKVKIIKKLPEFKGKIKSIKI